MFSASRRVGACRCGRLEDGGRSGRRRHHVGRVAFGAHTPQSASASPRTLRAAICTAKPAPAGSATSGAAAHDSAGAGVGGAVRCGAACAAFGAGGSAFSGVAFKCSGAASGFPRRLKYVRSSAGGAAFVGSEAAGITAGGCAAAGAGGAVSTFEAVGVPSGIAPRSALTPRPTRTPHRKITTDTTVAAMKRNTSCFPFSWISWKASS